VASGPRGVLTPDQALEGLALLRTVINPTPTADMNLHEATRETGIAVNHSTYDTLYLTFAIAAGRQQSWCRTNASCATCGTILTRPWPPC
jgi:hypothetical protein